MLDALKKLINKLNVNPDLAIVNLPDNYVLSRLFALSYTCNVRVVDRPYGAEYRSSYNYP